MTVVWNDIAAYCALKFVFMIRLLSEMTGKLCSRTSFLIKEPIS